jgi:hypothetical protein
MFARLVAPILAATLFITSAGPTPARADDDLVKALAVIAGAAIVGKIILDRNARAAGPQTGAQPGAQIVSRRYDAPLPRDRAPRISLRPVERPVVRVAARSAEQVPLAPQPLPGQVRRKLLPGDCLRSFDTLDGRKSIFGKECLAENYAFSDSLPRDCEVSFRALDRRREGYEAQCLSREGYLLARG